VAQSSWRGGQGDVLKDLSEACREYGLKFGVYISPWDRNDPAYGSPAYNEKYIRTLQSVHDGRYGPVFEQWFDGACGEGPNGKRQEYDWPAFHKAVWALNPDAVMFSDVGPGCRWMGNERGVAGETNWSRLDVEGFTPGAGAPPRDTLARGNVFGKQWIPGEIDVSIRPGWFWRESENAQVKSVEQLADIWLTSVGRNALLLLNVPPDTRGRIHEIDSTRLMEFRAWREKVLGVNLAADTGIRKRARGSIWEITLPEARTVNYVQLQEEIALGQRISGFRVEVEDAGGWRTVAEGTTIGYKRILPLASVTVRKVRVTITASLARPVLKDIALY
jgi:alpha-L-fucosidase